MLVIPREKLSDFMAHPMMDAEPQYQLELQTMASVILSDLPEEYTHLVYTDHQNGGDVQVTAEGEWLRTILIPERQDSENGYWGLVVFISPEDSRRFYLGYIGGSVQASTQDFLFTAARVFGS